MPRPRARSCGRLALHASDSLTATLNLAILKYERGEQQSALDTFDSFIDVYNNNSASLTSAELTDVAVAVEYLSVRNPELAKDALTAFDRATSLEPDNLDAKVLVGELFLDKYNHADAQTEFEDVLRSNPRLPRALVGAARRAEADHQPGADSLVAEALKVNPDYVPALLFQAEGRRSAARTTQRRSAMSSMRCARTRHRVRRSHCWVRPRTSRTTRWRTRRRERVRWH